MVQRASKEVAWDKCLAAKNAKSVESKLRVEVEGFGKHRSSGDGGIDILKNAE